MARPLLVVVVSLALVAFAFLSQGCATSPQPAGMRVWNPLTWFSRVEANAADRAESKLGEARTAEGEARQDLLRIAQRNAHETALALLSAPASRPVEVATESAEATADNLDQALGSLPAETRTAIRAQVSALLSDNAALRAEGETLRATARDIATTASRELTEAARRTTAAEAVSATARADLRSAYDRENALANELRNERFLRWAASVAAVAATLFGWAMRSNFLGLATSAGEIVGTMRAKYGVKDEDVMAIENMIDAPTTPSAQKRIASIAARTLAQLATAKAA